MGMMVVPLLLGTLITTFIPETPRVFGSFIGALFNGTYMALMGQSGRPEEVSREDAVHPDAGTVPAGTPGVR
ncbi:hypothetical protein MAE02_15480 [Microvirga aerophila]|uniref:Uncharacterized protein n=1 Tax=Microvirga aerophila TaxID=670291 RepID=A0A512BPH3_9HYPH|nr:hypothetical protein MAE02_15480 [Microvirga aerophila]